MVKKMFEHLTRGHWYWPGLGVIEAHVPFLCYFLNISICPLLNGRKSLHSQLFQTHGGKSISYDCRYSKAS